MSSSVHYQTINRPGLSTSFTFYEIERNKREDTPHARVGFHEVSTRDRTMDFPYFRNRKHD